MTLTSSYLEGAPQVDIGVLQFEIVPGEVERNYNAVCELLEGERFPARCLVVLPELFLTGFVYESMDRLYWLQEEFRNRLHRFCHARHIVVTGSLMEKTKGGRYLNSQVLLGSLTETYLYRKYHLFPGEEEGFVFGGGRPGVFMFGQLQLGFLICYDLRFPQLARIQAQQGAGLLICSAEWPLARNHHWQTLLTARAIENQCFVAGCNGLGRNGEVVLGGHSMIVDPDGGILANLENEPGAGWVRLDLSSLITHRNLFQSYAGNRPLLSSSEKMIAAERLVEVLENQLGLGQKIVCCLAGEENFSMELLQNIEEVRTSYDLLVCGSNSEELCAYLGHIGAVDMVVHVDEDGWRRLRHSLDKGKESDTVRWIRFS